MAEPEVRVAVASSSPHRAARVDVQAVKHVSSTALNVPPDIGVNTLSTVNAILSSLPGPVPAGTCIIFEPE